MTPIEFDSLCNRHQQSERRKDGRVASLMALLANINRDSKKKPRPFKPSDFLGESEPKEKNWKEQLKIVESLNKALGGDDRRDTE